MLHARMVRRSRHGPAGDDVGVARTDDAVGSPRPGTATRRLAPRRIVDAGIHRIAWRPLVHRRLCRAADHHFVVRGKPWLDCLASWLLLLVYAAIVLAFVHESLSRPARNDTPLSALLIRRHLFRATRCRAATIGATARLGICAIRRHGRKPVTPRRDQATARTSIRGSDHGTRVSEGSQRASEKPAARTRSSRSRP